MSFDRIFIDDDLRRGDFTLEAFRALPIYERVKFIMQGKLRFFCGSELVSQEQALRELRHASI